MIIIMWLTLNYYGSSKVITNQIDRDKKMALYFVLIAFNNSPSWRK